MIFLPNYFITEAVCQLSELQTFTLRLILTAKASNALFEKVFKTYAGGDRKDVI